jgi:hypothetical protein
VDGDLSAGKQVERQRWVALAEQHLALGQNQGLEDRAELLQFVVGDPAKQREAAELSGAQWHGKLRSKGAGEPAV